MEDSFIIVTYIFYSFVIIDVIIAITGYLLDFDRWINFIWLPLGTCLSLSIIKVKEIFKCVITKK